MKRNFLFILLCFLFILPCQALGRLLAPSVFAYAGLRIASNPGAANALESGFAVSVPLAEKTRVGLSLGVSLQTFGGAQGEFLYRGLTAAPFMVYLQQELFSVDHLSTYASLGAGIQFAGLRGQDRMIVPDTGVTRSIAPSFVMRAAGGLTLALVSRMRFFAEGAYLAGKATGKTQTFFLRRLVLEKRFRFDVKAVQLCLGVQYFF